MPGYNDTKKMIRKNHIMKNATVVYYNGEQETYDQIKITSTGIVIGRCIKSYDDKSDQVIEEIVYCGFIPEHAIKEIKNTQI